MQNMYFRFQLIPMQLKHFCIRSWFDRPSLSFAASFSDDRFTEAFAVIYIFLLCIFQLHLDSSLFACQVCPLVVRSGMTRNTRPEWLRTFRCYISPTDRGCSATYRTTEVTYSIITLSSLSHLKFSVKNCHMKSFQKMQRKIEDSFFKRLMSMQSFANTVCLNLIIDALRYPVNFKRVGLIQMATHQTLG